MTNEVGRLVIEASLLALSARERIPWRDAARGLREGDPRLHAEYRVALAWAVQYHLRGSHPHVEDVYVIGSALDENARRTSDLDLVLIADTFTSDDERTLREFNASVSTAYRELVGGVPDGFTLLDIHLVPRDAEHHPLKPLLTTTNTPTYRLPT